MKSQKYWRNRFEQLEDASNKYGLGVYSRIEPVFDNAMQEIEHQINTWYARFAHNNQVSMADARKLLNAAELKELKWDVKEYIEHGKNNDNGFWEHELENASTRFHISRLEALKIRTQHAAEKAFGNELDAVDEMCKYVYTNNYYHSLFELAKGTGIGKDIGTINTKKLDKLIKKPWAVDGKNFSERIWESKTKLIHELHNELTRNCILGKGPDEAIKNISKKFDVSKNQAGRLVMTEEAYFHAEAQKDAFNELDVKEFEIVATLDSHTSAICREMDGKHFPMKEYKPGVTAPPFHPWCRSCTCPYFDDEFSVGERIARDAEGNNYYVPSNMTYKEWEKEHVRDTVNKDDQEQYERYKKVLKKNAPDSIENFIEMKYNNLNKWENLKYQYRTVNRYEAIGNVTIDGILELDNAAWYTKNESFDRTKVSGHYKKKVDRIIKSGNTAAMKFENKIYFSHSSIEDLDNDVLSEVYNGKYQIVKALDDRQFKELDLGDGIPREFDTEAKFLEFVASKKKQNDSFTVTILSEKHICASCENIVEQFKKAFPRATVNIVSGKKGYNDNPSGTKTWKHRKKVQK